MAFNGLIKTATDAGQRYLHSNEPINSIRGALDNRISEMSNKEKFLDTNGEPTWGGRAKSLFYHRDGDFATGRAGAAVAGSYIGANEIANGSTGIPFI